MKKALLLIPILLLFTTTWAQKKKSYLYLEVNKNIPVQVSLNNKKLRNDNKGYIIVPKLPAGSNTLEFNFRNPDFKNHTFEIDTRSRSLGLKLARISDNKFVLQDVVNKTIIRDITSTTSNIKKSNVTKPKQDKGIIKTYTSNQKASKAKKQSNKVRASVKKAPTVSSTTTKPRTYAMYRNRRPQTARSNQNRYKDYGKLKRQRRKNNRQKQKNKIAKVDKRVNPTKETDNAAKEAERSARKKSVELKKKEQAKKEVEAYQALEKKRAERRAERTAKKQKRQAQIEARKQANIPQTKKVILPKKKKKVSTRKKFYEQGNPAISEKVINAEPVGNPTSQKTKKSYNEENGIKTIRCVHSVRPEKVADWTTKLVKKYDDEARTNYIRRKLGLKCISNNNLGVILANYETQIGRYKLIRSVYPQLESPSDILSFQKFFRSKSYITKLKELKNYEY